MNDETAFLSPPTTAKTRSFRESTYLIPTPGVDHPRPPRYEPFQLRLWVMLLASSLMIGLAIALEVALSFSNRNQGFTVPERNVFGRFASENFLTSFVPILLVAPLGLLWETSVWAVKRYQPYLNLAKGNRDAKETILLDYVSDNVIVAVVSSLSRGHWFVSAMGILGLLTLFLQPLTGSIFSIGQVVRSQDSTATSIRRIGLDPNRFQLTAFVSAAGYVQAAVLNDFGDPPFVNKNWTTADFIFPTETYLNGTMTVNTTGIRTTVDCSAPQSIALDLTTTTNFTIRATNQDNCPVTVFFNPQSAVQQYGVSNVPCSTTASLNITFQPVFFWFFHENLRNNTPEATGVFCHPFIEMFWLKAHADIANNSLVRVEPMTEITAENFPNNVTMAPQNQLAFNGVIFDPDPDDFINARAIATRSGVPGAMFLSLQRNRIEQQAFDSSDLLLSTVTKIYTQHLSLVAKNTYLIPAQEEVFAVLSAFRPRLFIEKFPAHALAVLLIIIGLTGLVVGILHWRERRQFFLAAAPGTIGSAVCLTSHSGFGQLLYPYDTQEAMESKMQGLRFGLDERTGAILTYDHYGAPTDVMGIDGGKNGGMVQMQNERPLSIAQKRNAINRGSSYLSASDETKVGLLGGETLGSPRDLGLSSAGYAVEPFVPTSGSSTPPVKIPEPEPVPDSNGVATVRFGDSEKR